MPYPLHPSAPKGQVDKLIVTNGKYDVEFLKLFYKYHSIIKNKMIYPPGYFPCERNFYLDRKNLYYNFLRSFFCV